MHLLLHSLERKKGEGKEGKKEKRKSNVQSEQGVKYIILHFHSVLSFAVKKLNNNSGQALLTRKKEIKIVTRKILEVKAKFKHYG